MHTHQKKNAQHHTERQKTKTIALIVEMSLLTPGWVLLTKKEEKSTHSLHPSTLPSLLCPPGWLMEGLPPPIPPPPSILFDKQHKHLKRSRHFNHFLNGVFLCKAMQTCAISRETGPRIKNVWQKTKQNKSLLCSHITKYVPQIQKCLFPFISRSK